MDFDEVIDVFSKNICDTLPDYQEITYCASLIDLLVKGVLDKDANYAANKKSVIAALKHETGIDNILAESISEIAIKMIIDKVAEIVPEINTPNSSKINLNSMVIKHINNSLFSINIETPNETNIDFIWRWGYWHW